MLFGITVLFLALYFFRPFELIPELIGTPILFWIGIFGIITLASDILRGKTRLFKNGSDQMMVGFLIAILMSDIAKGYLGGALRSLESILPTFLGYFLVAHGIKSMKQLTAAFWVIALSLAIPAMDGIFQHSSESIFGVQPLVQKLGDNELVRIKWTGVFADPNDLAMALIFPAPFLVCKIAEKKFITALPVFLLLLCATYLTGSRGGWLSLIVGLSAFILLKIRSLKLAGFGLLILATIIMLSPGRMGEIDAKESSAYGRVEAWYEGFQMFKTSPIFGVGMNMFTDDYQLTAHNSLVLVFAELGLFGALFFVGIFFFPIRNIYAVFRQGISVNDQSSNLMTVCASALFGLMCSMFFLSRSYMLLPYIGVAFCNSCSSEIVSAIQSSKDIWKVATVTILGILILNMAIKVML